MLTVPYTVGILFFVIPAKAGIQCFGAFLDSGLRRSDGFETFCQIINSDVMVNIGVYDVTGAS